MTCLDARQVFQANEERKKGGQTQVGSENITAQLLIPDISVGEREGERGREREREKEKERARELERDIVRERERARKRERECVCERERARMSPLSHSSRTSLSVPLKRFFKKMVLKWLKPRP